MALGGSNEGRKKLRNFCKLRKAGRYDSKAVALLVAASVVISGCGGGGSDDTSPSGTFTANVRPQTPPPFFCGAVGPSTSAVMADLNYFWQSDVKACSCETDALLNGCQGNAVVYGGNGYGYIFYDRNLLNSMDATGSTLPADFVMAHEFGHNIQLGLNLPTSGGKFKELQADCLGGYYVGVRIRRGLASQADVVRTFNSACGVGDPSFSPWWVQGAHGTCQERTAALQSGISGYLSGAVPGLACPSL